MRDQMSAIEAVSKAIRATGQLDQYFPEAQYPWDHGLMLCISRAALEASGAEDMLAALQQVEAEMRAGFGSSFGETREQVRRAIAKAAGV